MANIYTLTLAPSLDSATLTPQVYPEGKLRCVAAGSAATLNQGTRLCSLENTRNIYDYLCRH